MNSGRAMEMARRVYAEVVRGRTRVRVVSASGNVGSYPARFILSPYRSGTTLLRYCLDSHPDIAVPPETDYLYPLSSTLSDSESMVGVGDLGFEKADFAAELGNFARTLLDTYAEGKGAEFWVDKSPRYATIPDRISELYPQAQFIVLARNPLDQIYSFTRGGGFAHPALELAEGQSNDLILAAAARYWAETMRGLHRFAEQRQTQTLTIRYEDLCRRPEPVLRDVLAHLGTNWSPDVLEYHKFDHDKGREAGRVAGTVGFSLASGGWTALSDSQLEMIREIVSDAAALYGYDLDRPES